MSGPPLSLLSPVSPVAPLVPLSSTAVPADVVVKPVVLAVPPVDSSVSAPLVPESEHAARSAPVAISHRPCTPRAYRLGSARVKARLRGV
jgi:hypothetical protein